MTILWNDSHLECISDSYMHLRNMINKFVTNLSRDDALNFIEKEIKSHIGCFSGVLLDRMRMMKE